MKRYQGQRKGIALIAAIAFLLIMATIMALMVSMTAETTKRTSNVYFQEQAHLLAKSATEFALLAISGHDRVANGNCVEQINSTFPDAANPIYTVDTTIRYIGLDCNGAAGGNMDYIDAITTPESNGTVLIDVYVTTTAATNGLSEPVRFHRRTLQKP